MRISDLLIICGTELCLKARANIVSIKGKKELLNIVILLLQVSTFLSVPPSEILIRIM